MFNTVKFGGLLVLSLMIGCASGPSGKSFDSPIGECSETHETRKGGRKTVKLTIVDKTKGIDSHGVVLEIYSSDDAYTWKAYWIMDSGGYPCSTKKQGSPYWGEQVFRFNENYNEYEGTWNSCGEGKEYWSRGFR